MVQLALDTLGGELLDIDPATLDLDEAHGLEVNARRTHQYPPSGRYLTAIAVREPLAVTIADVAAELVGREQQERLVVRFRELGDCGLIATGQNLDILRALCGNDTDDWPGRTVELRRETATISGRANPCLRVHPATHTATASPTARAGKGAGGAPSGPGPPDRTFSPRPTVRSRRPGPAGDRRARPGAPFAGRETREDARCRDVTRVYCMTYSYKSTLG